MQLGLKMVQAGGRQAAGGLERGVDTIARWGGAVDAQAASLVAQAAAGLALWGSACVCAAVLGALRRVY